MMPEPKLKLEQLVNAQDLEAQLEALAEQELQPEATYRENADLSYKLDIPRDVDGLVALVEEKKRLEKQNLLLNINPNIDVEYSAFGGLVGIVGTVIITGAFMHYKVPVTFSNIVAVFIPSVVSILLGYRIGEYKSKKIKVNSQHQKEENITQLQAINKKLSHYEKSYNLGDFALVNDKELGYSLGEVYQLGDKLRLQQRYTKKEGEKDQSLVSSSDINENVLISILKPSRELSEDDLRVLSKQAVHNSTPIVTQYPAGSISGYGFVKEASGRDDYFTMYVDAEYNYSQCGISFEDIRNGNRIAKLLEPVIKPRITL